MKNCWRLGSSCRERKRTSKAEKESTLETNPGRPQKIDSLQELYGLSPLNIDLTIE